MQLTWYYGKDNKSIYALNLVEPMLVTDIPPVIIEQELLMEFFNATREDLLPLVLEEGSIANRIFEFTNHSIELEGNGEVITIGYMPDNIAENYRSVREAVRPGTSFWTGLRYFRGDTSFDHAGSTYLYYLDPEVGYNTFMGIPVFIRDYMGNVGIIQLALSDDRNRPKGSIYSRGTYIGGLSLDREFWNDVSNTAPEPEEGAGIVNIVNRYSPRVGTSGMGIYPMTTEQVTEFTMDLWETTFAEKLNELVNGNPMNSIVSLRWFYGLKNSIPRTALSTYLTLGNVAFNGVLTQSAIVTRPASSDLVTYTMGSIAVDRYFNNFLDNGPFTKLQLFIPYVGFIDLDATEFMGKRLRLDYNINVITGATIAYVYVMVEQNEWRIAHEQVTTMGVEIPLTVDAREHISSRIATTIAGMGAAGLGMAGMAATGPVGMAAGAGVAGATSSYTARAPNNIGVMQEAASGQLSNYSNTLSTMNLPSGNFTRNGGGVDNETGSLGLFRPHLLISRPQTVAPPDYNNMVGKPDHKSSFIKNLSGYFKVGAIDNTVSTRLTEDVAIPRQALDEIEQLLRAGVYVE